LALVKYVLESKTSIPFPEEENTRPYKKPYGYELFQENDERKNFEELEYLIKEEVKKKIKKYHFFRNKFEDISKSLLILSGIKGGQHTITIEMYRALILILELKGIKVKCKKNSNIRFQACLLENDKCPRGLKNLFNFSKKIGEIHNIEFECEGSKLSISVFLYYVDGKMSIMSFIENSIKETNGEMVFEKIEMEVDRIVRRLSIIDIVWKYCPHKGGIFYFNKSFKIFRASFWSKKYGEVAIVTVLLFFISFFVISIVFWYCSMLISGCQKSRSISRITQFSKSKIHKSNVVKVYSVFTCLTEGINQESKAWRRKFPTFTHSGQTGLISVCWSICITGNHFSRNSKTRSWLSTTTIFGLILTIYSNQVHWCKTHFSSISSKTIWDHNLTSCSVHSLIGVKYCLCMKFLSYWNNSTVSYWAHEPKYPLAVSGLCENGFFALLRMTMFGHIEPVRRNIHLLNMDYSEQQAFCTWILRYAQNDGESANDPPNPLLRGGRKTTPQPSY